MTERGCWVYAVTDRDPAQDLSWLTGVAGTRVRPVRSAGMTALISDVDLAEFGADALRRNLEDLQWLERTARAHHEVIDAASRIVPLLPMRLATVYHGEPTLADALEARREDFLAALEQVGGRVEWGVKAYAQPQPGREAPGGGGDAGAAGAPGESTPGESAAPGGGGAGMAYLKKRRAQMTARQDARRDGVEGAREVHAGLARHAAQARLHPPQSPQLSGERTPMLLNAAYLLRQSEGTGFAEAVAAAAAAHPELRVELTGPWPPYSFAGEDTR
jgi:gas vesicle protein GvpL/GvpF